MMDLLRAFAQRTLGIVDQGYHRAHALRPVGPLLFIGQDTYRGPAKRFTDGTLLEAGGEVGMLHFNNRRLSQLQVDSPTAAGLGFARLMLKSLHCLAETSRCDPAFSGITVYYGVTGLPPHGQRVGFITAPVPDGPRRRLMIAYFRLLLWTFAPARTSRRATPDPHFYWLTRTELLRRFPKSARGDGPDAGRRIADADSRFG